MHFDFGVLEMHLKNDKLKRKSWEFWILKMHFHGFRKLIYNFWKCISMDFGNGFSIFENSFLIFRNGFPILEIDFQFWK